MKCFAVLPALIVVLISSCEQPGVPPQPITPRDTTIRFQNAFTALKLDSVSVARFLSGNVINDSLKNKMTSFYNARNYQYAWFTEDDLSEAGQAFWNLHQKQAERNGDTTANDPLLHSAMQRLLNEEEAPFTTDSIQQIEVNLTLHFFRYVKTAFGGTVDPSAVQWHIPKRKLDAAALLDSFLSGNGKELKPLSNSF